MSQYDDEWERRRLYLRYTLVNIPVLSPILESRESLEQSLRSDAVGELIVERTARHRPADDEPEEVYEQLERKIRKYWRTLSNTKFTDGDDDFDDSVELDPKIYIHSDVSTAASVVENCVPAIESRVDHSMSDDESQLEHESTDKQISVTSDTDEEDLKYETDDMDHEIYEEVEEEIGEEVEEEIVEDVKMEQEMVGDIGHKMGEHMGKLDKNVEKETENENESQEFENADISNPDSKKEELNQNHATNQSDLGSSDDTMHLVDREISNNYGNSVILNAPSLKRQERHENKEITLEALVARNSKSEPTKAQLKVYEDKRDDDVETTTSGNHSDNSGQLSERQEENVEEQGSQDGDKQNTGDDHQSEKNSSLKEREENSEIESQVSDKRDDDDESNLRAALPRVKERDDINEEGSQDSNKSDDADMLSAAIPTAEERGTDTLDETSADKGVRLIIQEVEVEVMRSHNPSPAADSFDREVERNSSTSTIQRPSFNAKRSLVEDQNSSAIVIADEIIIMANELREEIHPLVTTPTPLRPSGSKRAGSDPATEATTPKRNVNEHNVRKTEDVEVQTEQKTRTTGNQTDNEMFRFRNWEGYIHFWFN